MYCFFFLRTFDYVKINISESNQTREAQNQWYRFADQGKKRSVGAPWHRLAGLEKPTINEPLKSGRREEWYALRLTFVVE
jgi:hypothetical protein